MHLKFSARFKRALVSVSTEISSEILTKMVQQMSDGTKPDFIEHLKNLQMK